MKIPFFVVCGLSFLLGACATSQSVDFADPATPVSVKSAFFVPRGGNSLDMDQALEKSLRKRGLEVTSGPEAIRKPVPGEMLVVYDDAWRWDVTMYLYRLNVKFYDHDRKLIATGNWANSAFHGFPDAEKVVDGLIAEMFRGVRVGNGAPLARFHMAN